MKKALYCIAAVIALASCSLKEEPESFVDRENYFKSEAQIKAAVNSVYAQLRTLYTYRLFTLTEATTDLMYEKATTVVEARMELSPAQPGYSATIWQKCYQMVMYSNYVLEGIKVSGLPEETTLPYAAETTIMRAFYYYLLTSFFGDVPYYEDDIADQEAMNRAAVLPRMSAFETRAKLIKQIRGYLSYAEDGSYTGVLPQLRTSDVPGNRSGWAMGEMLIAKLAMWNAAEDPAYYDTAIEACLHLESIYGTLDQYPIEDILFRVKNSPESIFEIQHTWSTGGVSYASNLACVCTPTKYQTTLEDGTIVTTYGASYEDGGLVIEELGDDPSVWTAVRPNKYFSSGIQTKADGDLRATVNMAWQYNGKTIPGTGSRPWMGPKFWCPHMYTSNDSNNYKIFRYADALLMAAECYAAKDDSENAVKYLNMVKRRAGLADYSWRSSHYTLLEIQDERARELFGEFQRKFDLVRWGVWYERVRAFSDYSTLVDIIKPCHRFLPIPDKQVVYSGHALDNKEYNQYGL